MKTQSTLFVLVLAALTGCGAGDTTASLDASTLSDGGTIDASLPRDGSQDAALPIDASDDASDDASFDAEVDASDDASFDAEVDASIDLDLGETDASVDATVIVTDDASIDANRDATVIVTDDADVATEDADIDADIMTGDASEDAGVDAASVSDGGKLSDKFTTSFVVDTPPENVCSTVRYSATTSGDPNGAVTYTWEFGDGTTATGASVEHRFARSGSMTVKLIATDSSMEYARAEDEFAVASAERTTRLRFSVRASDPDQVDYIRSVRVVAPSLGFTRPIRLFDDGIVLGDVAAGDGMFANEVLVEPCVDLATNVRVVVEDAAGRTTELVRPASTFVSE